MKVKISDRESESKMKRWMDGEVEVFSRESINCMVNDVDAILLSKRNSKIEDDLEDEEDFMSVWSVIYN